MAKRNNGRFVMADYHGKGITARHIRISPYDPPRDRFLQTTAPKGLYRVCLMGTFNPETYSHGIEREFHCLDYNEALRGARTMATEEDLPVFARSRISRNHKFRLVGSSPKGWKPKVVK